MSENKNKFNGTNLRKKFTNYFHCSTQQTARRWENQSKLRFIIVMALLGLNNIVNYVYARRRVLQGKVENTQKVILKMLKVSSWRFSSNSPLIINNSRVWDDGGGGGREEKRGWLCCDDWAVVRDFVFQKKETIGDYLFNFIFASLIHEFVCKAKCCSAISLNHSQPTRGVPSLVCVLFASQKKRTL